MNPSRLFIQRPVATILLMVAVLLSGIFAYNMLSTSALPQVDYPTIQVTTLYPGASPDVMASGITAPLERQLGQMAGLSQMYSTSASGSSIITLKFSLDLSLDVAEQEVQAAINAADSLLPNDLPNPPTYKKVNPADSRRADAGRDLRIAAADQSAGSGEHPRGAEIVANLRRRHGDAGGRTSACDPRSGRSAQAGRTQSDAGRPLTR